MEKVFVAEYSQTYYDEEPACFHPIAVCKTRERAEQFIAETRQSQWEEMISNNEVEVDDFFAFTFAHPDHSEEFIQALHAYLASLEGIELYPATMPNDPAICDFLIAQHFDYTVDISVQVTEREVLE